MPATEHFTDDQLAEQDRAYRTMLIERYVAGLPMPAADKREARKLIREAAAFERQRQTSA